MDLLYNRLSLASCRQSTPFPAVAHKKCSSCGEVRAAEWFSPARGPSGLNAWCRPCSTDAAAQRRLRHRLRNQSTEPPPEKECSICLKTVPGDSLVKDAGSRDGLHRYCKECASKAQKARRALRKGLSRDALPEVPASKERICPLCGTLKPSTYFGKASYTVFGIEQRCKQCMAGMARDYRAQKSS